MEDSLGAFTDEEGGLRIRVNVFRKAIVSYATIHVFWCFADIICNAAIRHQIRHLPESIDCM